MAWLHELVFPSRCVACEAPGPLLCDGCAPLLRRVGPPSCARCGAPTAWPVLRCSECARRRLAFDSAEAAVCYSGPARAFVHAWKERGLRRLAPIAAELVSSRVPRPAAAVITYIPPDGDRSVKRGHQPARDLAHALGERWGVPVASLLERTRTVARQTALTRAERRRNVRHAFRAAAASIPPRVVLVDDVYTTGATADAAASALRSAGADHVLVVTFARAVR
jgi:predicted amidophosphoribosyltransferase